MGVYAESFFIGGGGVGEFALFFALVAVLRARVREVW